MAMMAPLMTAAVIEQKAFYFWPCHCVSLHDCDHPFFLEGGDFYVQTLVSVEMDSQEVAVKLDVDVVVVVVVACIEEVVFVVIEVAAVAVEAFDTAETVVVVSVTPFVIAVETFVVVSIAALDKTVADDLGEIVAVDVVKLKGAPLVETVADADQY